MSSSAAGDDERPSEREPRDSWWTDQERQNPRNRWDFGGCLGWAILGSNLITTTSAAHWDDDVSCKYSNLFWESLP